MSSIYKILFTPLEEYFFGDEGSFFSEIDEKQGYYLVSKDIPSQTTIFGIIRYLGLAHIKSDYNYTSKEYEANKTAIGCKGFNIEKAITENNSQKDFGKIKNISSIFIHEFSENLSKIFVPIPKDAKFDKSKYSSILEEYVEIEADNSKKYVPKNFDYKKGILDGYISIDYGYDTVKNELKKNTGDLEILTDLFTGIVKSRIRIYSNEEREKRKKNNEEDDEMSSLFKREYKIFNPKINKELSFGVFLETDFDDDYMKKHYNTIVGMGLGNKKFKVACEKVEAEKIRLKENLTINVDKIFEKHNHKNNIIYFISPSWIEENKIRKKSLFASINSTRNRPQINNSEIKNQIEKTKTLYRMIDSGSIIITDNKDEILKKLNNIAMKQIGYNHIYVGGEKNGK